VSEWSFSVEANETTVLVSLAAPFGDWADVLLSDEDALALAADLIKAAAHG
jgi:hypothetical protein